MVATVTAQLKGVLRLEPGGKVKVRGLEKKPELNGLVGELLQFDSVKLRWGVQLPDGAKVLLKMGNLLPVDTTVSPAVGGSEGQGPRPDLPQQSRPPDGAVQVEDPLNQIERPSDIGRAGEEDDQPAGQSHAEAGNLPEEPSAVPDPVPHKAADEPPPGALPSDNSSAIEPKPAFEMSSEDFPELPSKSVAADASGAPPAEDSDEAWPVPTTTPEQAAKARSGRWFTNESAATYFAQQLRDNDPKLTSLCLVPPKRFNEDDAKDICTALEGNDHCLELLASGHCLQASSCELLAGMLQTNKALQMLSVGDSSLGDGALTLFEGLSKNMSIKSLDLELKGLTARGGQALAEALVRRSSAGAPALTSLRLSRNPLIRDALEALAEAPAPQELFLCECTLTERHARGLGAWVAKGIEVLDLRDNSGLGGEGVELLIQTSVGFTRARTAVSSASAVPLRLRHLRLDGCSIGDDGLEALAEALTVSQRQNEEPALALLEELFLERCELTRVGCEALARGLRGRRLSSLSVRANVIGDEGCQLLGGCAERLDLSSTNLSGQILSVLGKEPITSLELFSNPTLGPSVETWCSALDSTHWQLLESLDLSGCALGDAGFGSLIEKLLQRPELMPRLQNLCLGGNDINEGEKWDPITEELGEARGGQLRVVWKNS